MSEVKPEHRDFFEELKALLKKHDVVIDWGEFNLAFRWPDCFYETDRQCDQHIKLESLYYEEYSR